MFPGHCLLCASLWFAGDSWSAYPSCLIEDCTTPMLLAEAYALVPAPPKVSVWCQDCKACKPANGKPRHCAHCCRASSADWPPSRVELPPLPLRVRVEATELMAAMAKVEKGMPNVTCVELYLDAKLLEVRQTDSPGKTLQTNFLVSIPPGKHTLRARYRLNHLWSHFSAPLSIEVRYPEPPEIIAVSNGSLDVSAPLPREGSVSLSERTWRLKLSNVHCGDQVIISLDGHPIRGKPTVDKNQGTVSIEPNVPPGLYSLIAQVVPAGCDRQLASQPSKPVVIRYEPGNVWTKSKQETSAADTAKTAAEGPPTAAVEARSDAFLWRPAPPKRQSRPPLPRRPWHPWHRQLARWQSELQYWQSKLDKWHLELENWHRELLSRASSSEPREGTARDGKTRGGPDAFCAVPKPNRVPQEGDTNSIPTCDEKGESEQSGEPRYSTHFRFLSPAHFPLRGFDPQAGVLDREGALIYEGMRFSCDRNGQYQVSFLVRTPAMPTTLQLRFLVQKKGKPKPWQTVTLPPIQIEPDKDRQDGPKAAVWRIRHCGYSAAIESHAGFIQTIRREGTARFGFGASL